MNVLGATVAQAHEQNMDAAQREIDARAAEGEDMRGAYVDPHTYAIQFHAHFVGQGVRFTGTFSIDLGDMQCNIRKDSEGLIVLVHQDNEDLPRPEVDGLFLVEIPTRHNYRVWVRAHRIAAI